VVDTRKELTDISLESILVPAGIELGAVQGAVGTLANAIGVAIRQEGPLKHRLDNVAQGMVDHPVAKRRGADEAALGFVDVKANIRAWAVAALGQLGPERHQIFFEPMFEPRHIGAAPFATAGLAIGEEEVIPGGNSF
jgi:hypothetical protein